MSEQERHDLAEIEVLLATRQRLTDWMERLDGAGTRTPSGVKQRVRTDYEGRLVQVVQQLRGHSDVLNSNLQGLRTQAGHLEHTRQEEQEILAEAELRHLVGEYNAEEWGRVEQESSGKIAGLNAELGHLGNEIRRLEEVLAQIAATSPPAPVHHSPPPRREEPAPLHAAPPLTLVKDEPAPAAASVEFAGSAGELPEAPRFMPRGAKSRDSGPTRAMPIPTPQHPAGPGGAGVDELTFLKSMTLDVPQTGGRTPGPAHSSGSSPATVEAKPSERSGQTAVKTLKCGECGALNRPTEWYCERCGAELAAL